MATRGWGLFSLYIYIENLKNLLVRNHSTDFSIILQQAIWIHQKTWLPGRGGGGSLFSLYIYIENLKNLIRNHWNDCNIMWQKCSFGDPVPRFSSHLDSSKNMAARGRGLFSLYIYIEKLGKSSCQKPLDRFHYNLAKMFPWWPSTKSSSNRDLSKNMAARG